jgi:hypothetical protein
VYIGTAPLKNLVSARPWPSAASPQAPSALRIQRRRTKPRLARPLLQCRLDRWVRGARSAGCRPTVKWRRRPKSSPSAARPEDSTARRVGTSTERPRSQRGESLWLTERRPGSSPPRSGFVVCRACSTAWGCKSPTQPDGGEVLAKRNGVAARRRPKAARSQTAT